MHSEIFNLFVPKGMNVDGCVNLAEKAPAVGLHGTKSETAALAAMLYHIPPRHRIKSCKLGNRYALEWALDQCKEKTESPRP